MFLGKRWKTFEAQDTKESRFSRKNLVAAKGSQDVLGLENSPQSTVWPSTLPAQRHNSISVLRTYLSFWNEFPHIKLRMSVVKAKAILLICNEKYYCYKAEHICINMTTSFSHQGIFIRSQITIWVCLLSMRKDQVNKWIVWFVHSSTRYKLWCLNESPPQWKSFCLMD